MPRGPDTWGLRSHVCLSHSPDELTQIQSAVVNTPLHYIFVSSLCVFLSACSSSCCLSVKVSVILRTQHVSICSVWPGSALCSSTCSPLSCLLFHLWRVFLFLAADFTPACKEFTKTPTLFPNIRGELRSVLMSAFTYSLHTPTDVSHFMEEVSDYMA